MANDLEGHVDKLSEAVGVLGERVARLEHEQRATRSSIDQLTGEVRQFDKRLGDIGGLLDKRLGDMQNQFDRRLNDMNTQFDKRLNDMNTQFDKRLNDMNTQFDKRLEQFDKRLEHMTNSFERRITDIKWVISVGMGLIVLLMTLYRFVQIPAIP